MHHSRLGIRTIFIETTNYCNFHCEFCPIRVSRRPRQHMSYGLLRRTIDEIASNQICDTVAFYLLGEPLLYPHIVDAVYRARSKGLKPEITTNGSMLTAEVARGLVDAGLSKLTISLQRYGPADHRERGAPISFERYYRRILDAITTMNSVGGETEIVLMFMSASFKRLFDVDLPMSINWDRASFEADLKAIVNDAYTATGIEVNGHGPEISTAVHQLGTHRAFLYRINDRTLIGVKPFLDWGGAFTTREIVPSKYGYCSMAFSSLGILSNGDVVLCCGDYDGDTSLGNINDRPLIAILSSDRAEAVRKGLSHYRLIDPRCQICFGGPSRFKALFKSVVQTGVCKIVKPVPGKKVREVRPL